jgi:hypothetical protein
MSKTTKRGARQSRTPTKPEAFGTNHNTTLSSAPTAPAPPQPRTPSPANEIALAELLGDEVGRRMAMDRRRMRLGTAAEACVLHALVNVAELVRRNEDSLIDEASMLQRSVEDRPITAVLVPILADLARLHTIVSDLGNHPTTLLAHDAREVEL